jgi:hypothetical protein
MKNYHWLLVHIIVVTLVVGIVVYDRAGVDGIRLASVLVVGHVLVVIYIMAVSVIVVVYVVIVTVVVIKIVNSVGLVIVIESGVIRKIIHLRARYYCFYLSNKIKL